MNETQDKTIVDESGRPLRRDTRCPTCGRECAPGDPKARARSGGFGRNVHDVCRYCGHPFPGELTV